MPLNNTTRRIRNSNVKLMLERARVSRKDIAESLGCSLSNLNDKFTYGTFTASDLIQIADICGYKLAFIKDDSAPIIFDKSDLKIDSKE